MNLGGFSGHPRASAFEKIAIENRLREPMAITPAF